MKIQKLTLRNWKNFTEADVEIHDRLFLVGPNASGKSNFLDAFRFLRDLASTGGGFQVAVERRGGVTALRCLAARRNSNITLGVVVRNGAEEWEYELSFNQDKQRRAAVRSERVRRGDDILLSRPTDEDEKDPARLTQTYLEQVNVNQPFRALATFFASIRYLHIVPQLVREPDRSVGRANDPFGGDFLEQVAKIPEKTRNKRLQQIQEALRVAVPQLEKIELYRDQRGTPHLRGKYQHWRPQGAWQTEEQFSDGTLRLMGLLWVALESGGPLLLEEPELSLHPEVVRFLPQMFARVQRRTKRQIFLSTHSPALLCDEGIGLDEVLLLSPTPEGTKVSVAGSHQEIRDLLEGGLTLAEAVIPLTKPERASQLTSFGEA
ncbi:AAA family ATPase [Desulfoglaeba alkanexedens]|uniref:Chromosome segregation protein SMC n=1 Tax=Desulfoglaeba alkanexedens ALDC TaxID=980445 RepID=A0A4P8L239_9BACT|nr:ATP-binding protein [Desulfoglaeba alkanexedens]QCQ21774.1 chromosome segregation protein SMC [Desulfoglaeba alkanexedens ALDC]